MLSTAVDTRQGPREPHGEGVLDSAAAWAQVGVLRGGAGVERRRAGAGDKRSKPSHEVAPRRRGGSLARKKKKRKTKTTLASQAQDLWP